MNKTTMTGLSPKHLLMAALLGCTVSASAAEEKAAEKLVPTFTEWHDLQVNEVNRLTPTISLTRMRLSLWPD